MSQKRIFTSPTNLNPVNPTDVPHVDPEDVQDADGLTPGDRARLDIEIISQKEEDIRDAITYILERLQAIKEIVIQCLP